MRLQQVCVRMGCQEKFELCVLSESEAWALFKDKADLKDDASMLNEIAKEVAYECKGLPLAIVTIGKAIKGESLEEWIAANKRFKDSRHLDNEDELFCNVEKLKLSNVREHKNIVPSNNMEWLMDTTGEKGSITAFSNLGAIQVGTFQNLRCLIVCKNDRLKSLFSPLLAQNLAQLTTLKIESCERLEEIIAIEDQTSIASSSSQGHLQPIPFPVLKELEL
ncbi:hypothetical protein PTKIN_Ptkin14bG0048300 [Pterospermum kingtungense]